MKKAQIKAGNHYVAKVSKQLTIVQLCREHPLGGWDAVNIATGRMVRVKTAGRLRRSATVGEIERKKYGFQPETKRVESEVPRSEVCGGICGQVTKPEEVPHLVNTAYREMAQMIVDLTDGHDANDIRCSTGLPEDRCQEIIDTRNKLFDILK